MNFLDEYFKYEIGTEISGLTNELNIFFVEKLSQKYDRNIIVLTSSLFEANKIYDELVKIHENTLLFPMDDFLSSMIIASSPELKYKRLETLDKIKDNKKYIIVTNLMGYLKYLPSKDIKNYFDVILTDVPCSGEGMFRKDKEAIDTWSMQKINECAYIQRNLIDQAYKMLKKDGILIYSTCTYSLDENEKQVEYMINELGMKLLPINKKEGMSDGFIEGTIRMYPHINRGEGQFIAMLQKTTETAISKEKILKPNLKKEQLQLVQKFYQENLNIPVPPYLYQSNNHVYAILNHFPELPIKVLRNGLYLGECKKGRFEPSLSLALTLNKEDVKRSYNFKCDSQEVKDYLSGLTLKGNNQKGYGVIFVDGYPLSFYKESNNQVKNLYPKGLRR